MPDPHGAVEITPGPVTAPAVVTRSVAHPNEADQASPEQVSGVPRRPEPTPAPVAPQAAPVPVPPELPPPDAYQIAPENQGLSESYQAIQRRNAKVMDELAAMGAQVSATDILDLRMKVLLDTLWPMEDSRNQRRRILFERSFAEALNEKIEPLVSEARQFLLGQGANLSPDQLQEMAQEHGIQAPAARRTRPQGG